MPIFEFQCEKCQQTFQKLLPNSRARTACPNCSSKRVQRRFSTFSAHGSTSPASACVESGCPHLPAGGACPSAGACGLGH